MDIPRSPSPSRVGKRRLLQSQESLSEPPLKSPTNTPVSGSPIHDSGLSRAFDSAALAETLERNREYLSQNIPPQSDQSPGSSNDVYNTVTSPRVTLARHSACAKIPSLQKPLRVPKPNSQPTQSSKFNIFLRRDSKGLIDEYFTKKQERRRSSCKEVTLKTDKRIPRQLWSAKVHHY